VTDSSVLISIAELEPYQ